MNLLTDLLAYQQEGVNKLVKIKVGALYCEMGTGKTRMSLELINTRLQKNKVEHAIWLCPCSVRNNLKLDIIKHLGYIPGNFTIAGIESLSSSTKLSSELLNLVTSKKCYLIVDESNLVKNHKAKRSINIERLAQNCKYKLILNGTPIARNEADLFFQWYILDWRILGYRSFYSFAGNHLEYDDYGKIRKTLEVERLTEKIAPYTFQVTKAEVLELPSKKYHNYYFGMTYEQGTHYSEVADEYLMNVDEFDSSTIYRLFTALQHVLAGRWLTNKCNEKIETSRMFEAEDNPRIKRLMDVIDTDKTIIFAKYTDEIKDIAKILRKKYGDDSTVEFYGEISQKNRIKAIEKFETTATYFVANKSCAGYGLNLQFCSDVIYYSNDWDYATRIQSEDRVHRMGQKNTVHISDIICPGTLDERIVNCLRRKENLADSFKNNLKKEWLNGKNL